ncbi:MAG TPA: Gfo/Idh/MocA family oxidoreductase [Chitinophagaceae bacterium]|nr:Gfo/Idh/MocA family oxidoreductase [Chitinophagaceae bacterium]
MDTRPRFALLGCGRIAARHAAEMNRLGKLVAVCDIIAERADRLAGQYGAAAYYRLEDLLACEKGLTLVAVCTPNGLHAEQSIRILRSGIHVLCEKPMAISLADASQMIQAAQQTARKLYVVKQNRFNPPVALVKDLLRQGRLGRITQFEINAFWNRPSAYYQGTWRGSRQLDGGTLYTQFSHFVDILYWFLGEVDTVKCLRVNALHRQDMEFEDAGAVLLAMQSGAIGTFNFSVNTYARNMEGSFALLGEKGTVKIGGQYLNELDYFQVQDLAAPILTTDRPANQYGFYEGSMSNHDRVYDQLVRALADHDHAMVTADEAIKSVEIIERIYQESSWYTREAGFPAD